MGRTGGLLCLSAMHLAGLVCFMKRFFQPGLYCLPHPKILSSLARGAVEYMCTRQNNTQAFDVALIIACTSHWLFIKLHMDMSTSSLNLTFKKTK